MKKIDYICIVYSIALLIFGFNDDVPKQKRAVQAIDSTTKARHSIRVESSDQTRRHLQYASIARGTQKPSVQMQKFVAAK